MKQSIVMGIIRAVLASIGGALASAGLVDDESAKEMVGAALILSAGIWSAVEKYRANHQVVKNLKVPVIVLALVGGLLVCGGCSTTQMDVEMAKVAAATAQAYYQQPNCAEYMRIKGSNVEFCIKGAHEVVFSGPIPPKSIYPRDQGTLEKVIDGAKDIAKTAGLTAVGYAGVQALKPQAPTVVTTEKLVPVEGAVTQ